MQSVSLRSWLIWLTAGIFYLYEFIHRVMISVMIPELMVSFKVSVATLGQLSAFYFYAYAIAQIPVGVLIDRYGTRGILTLACLLISIGSLAFAITDNFIIAYICRVLIGFGSAFAFVGCLKLGTVWFPSHKFAFIVGLTNLLGITGALIGGKPIAMAVDAVGWRNVMYCSTAIGLVIAFLLWRILIDHPATKVSGVKSRKQKVQIGTLMQTVKNKQIWAVAVFGGLMVAPIATYSELWGVTFLIDHYQIDRPDAALIAGYTFIGIAIGGPLIGWISDRIYQRKLPLLVGLFAALLSIGCILLFRGLPLWLLALLHLSFGFFSSSMLLCFSLAAEVTEAKIRAQTIALTNMVIMILGATLQTVTSNLLEYSHSDFNISFAPMIICYVIALYFFNVIHEPRGKHDY